MNNIVKSTTELIPTTFYRVQCHLCAAVEQLNSVRNRSHLVFHLSQRFCVCGPKEVLPMPDAYQLHCDWLDHNRWEIDSRKDNKFNKNTQSERIPFGSRRVQAFVRSTHKYFRHNNQFQQNEYTIFGLITSITITNYAIFTMSQNIPAWILSS